MPAEFKCPNGHLNIYDGIGSNGVLYNCRFCMAEGKSPYQHELPQHLRPVIPGADTTSPVEVRTVVVPEGPIVIEIPGSETTPSQPSEQYMTVRELAEGLGITDLRKFIPKLKAAGVDINRGEDLVPRSLKDKIEFVKAEEAAT